MWSGFYSFLNVNTKHDSNGPTLVKKNTIYWILYILAFVTKCPFVTKCSLSLNARVVNEYPFVTKIPLERVFYLWVGEFNSKPNFWKEKKKFRWPWKNSIQIYLFNEMKNVFFAAWQISRTFKQKNLDDLEIKKIWIKCFFTEFSKKKSSQLVKFLALSFFSQWPWRPWWPWPLTYCYETKTRSHFGVIFIIIIPNMNLIHPEVSEEIGNTQTDTHIHTDRGATGFDKIGMVCK